MSDLKSIFESLCPMPNPIGFHSSSIKILQTPSEFHKRLIHNILNAKERISIGSLYLGNSSQYEKELVDAIETSCIKNPSLTVHIVFDHSRGQRRGGSNSKSSYDMVYPLVEKFGPDRIQICLYQVPQLQGKERLLRSPLNETIGVFHIKAYVFDNTVIMSGANLSVDYFTNRQDRYIEFTNVKDVATFYHKLIKIICQHSYDYKLNPPTSESPQEELKNALNQLMLHFTTSKQNENQEFDTFCFPTLQFTPLNISYDKTILHKLLTQCLIHQPNYHIQIASGYLNFPYHISNLLLQSKPGTSIDIITASPQANGFYNASKIKGSIPMAYSSIEKEFYNKVEEYQRNLRIYEYIRKDWTFHAKGLWCSKSSNTTTSTTYPEITVIGSSNFGKRSFQRDFESQVYIYTKSPHLREQFFNEYQRLTQDTELVTKELWKRNTRKLYGFGWKQGLWIRPMTRLIASFL